MKWFKHDTSAHRDVKLKRLKRRYGITGYGLYWYCLELIAGKVDGKTITFELEDDCEDIAAEWDLDRVTVSEMMTYMVELNLFESDSGRIVCLKLANRLDESASKNPDIREAVKRLRSEGKIPTPSGANQKASRQVPDKFPNHSGPDKIRLDENRLEQNLTDPDREKTPTTQTPRAVTSNADFDEVDF